MTQKRNHPCTLLLRARLVPARAGADTQAVVHIPLSQLRQLPGAAELEDAWSRAKAGQDGYLAGTDAQTVPVVTGTMDPDVIDQMIALSRIAAEADSPGGAAGTAVTAAPGNGAHAGSRSLSSEAWRALRYAMARLAVDLVSGPAGGS
jgi:hypothetical protein